MSYKMFKLMVPAFAAALLWNYPAHSTDKQGSSPLDELPPHIRRVTHFGQRADWSHDGKRILFIEKTFGDVYEVELATGEIVNTTKGLVLKAKPYPEFMLELISAGGLIEYTKHRLAEDTT